jgi:hypothetical protein
VLVVLVYIEGLNKEALVEAANKLDQLIRETQNQVGIYINILLIGDFN